MTRASSRAAVNLASVGAPVMTLGWAEGVPLGDNAAIDAAGHDRKALGDARAADSFCAMRCATASFTPTCTRAT
jgi:hypothetical protein